MKIAICTPVYGDTRADFTFSLAEMLLETQRKRPDLELKTFTIGSSNVALNRDELVKMAIDWEADWILWIDSDHSFPPESLLRLLSLNEPFVGCNQPRRNPEAQPTAGLNDETVWTTKQKAMDGLVETVDHMGLAFCLVSMKAVREAGEPLFFGTQDGEDVIFCRKLRDAGYAPKVDHRLSYKVGHIGLRTYTLADSIQRKQLKDMQKDIEQRRALAAKKSDAARIEVSGGQSDTQPGNSAAGPPDQV